MAEKLSSIVDVTIITDAQMNLFIPHCDLCLVGADTVCTDGSIISKCGTCLAAMSAKYHNVPYLVVLHTFKWTSETKHVAKKKLLPLVLFIVFLLTKITRWKKPDPLNH